MTDYDLFSRRFKADPFPTFDSLRRESPIYPHAAPDGSTIWYITRYDDVAAVLKDDRHFCKDVSNAREASERKKGPRDLINDNMLFSDPPDHSRLRALVSQAFTPRRMAAMGGRIGETAAALLEQAAPSGAMDLISAYALPLPVIVISDLLGIPTGDRDDVAAWSQAIISPGSRGLNYSARKQQVRAFVSYLSVLFAERQAEPRDDLISALVRAEEAGDRLSEAELFSMVALLLVTGHETTVNLIGNGALALLRHPEQRARLMASPALWPAAVEELLRFDGPVETSTLRWVREDVEMVDRGSGRIHNLRRGDQVRVCLAAANHDPEQFHRPAQFDLDRDDNRHLAFGLGAHYCLGAPLARLEGLIALRTLFDRFPDLYLPTPIDELAWRSGVLFRGLRELPVAWTT